MPRRCSSGSWSLTVEPSSTRPSRLIVPAAVEQRLDQRRLARAAVAHQRHVADLVGREALHSVPPRWSTVRVKGEGSQAPLRCARGGPSTLRPARRPHPRLRRRRRPRRRAGRLPARHARLPPRSPRRRRARAAAGVRLLAVDRPGVRRQRRRTAARRWRRWATTSRACSTPSGVERALAARLVRRRAGGARRRDDGGARPAAGGARADRHAAARRGLRRPDVLAALGDGRRAFAEIARGGAGRRAGRRGGAATSCPSPIDADVARDHVLELAGERGPRRAGQRPGRGRGPRPPGSRRACSSGTRGPGRTTSSASSSAGSTSPPITCPVRTFHGSLDDDLAAGGGHLARRPAPQRGARPHARARVTTCCSPAGGASCGPCGAMRGSERDPQVA